MFFYCSEETQLLEIPDFLGDSDSCVETTFYPANPNIHTATSLSLLLSLSQSIQHNMMLATVRVFLLE